MRLQRTLFLKEATKLKVFLAVFLVATFSFFLYILATNTFAANTRCLVTFNDNGGSGGPGSQGFWVEDEDSAEADFYVSTPTKSGSTFLGYYDSQTGGTQIWDANGHPNTSSYAFEWGPNDLMWIVDDSTFTVWAHWSGGSSYTATPTLTTTGCNSFSISATNANNYCVTTTNSSSSCSWSSTSTYTASSAGTYYVWVRNSNNQVSSNYATKTAYTISRSQGTGTTLTTRCNSTSSSTGTAFTSSQVVLSGVNVWAKATLKTGYTGTVTLKHGSTSMTASGSYFSVSSSQTITSGGATQSQTVVTFNANGGSGGPGTETFTYGAYDAALDYMTPATRSGYTFKGWYDDTSGGVQIWDSNGYYNTSSYGDAPGDPQYDVWEYAGATLTVYAQWEENYTATPTLTTTGCNTFSISATNANNYCVTTTNSYSSCSWSSTSTYTASSAGTYYVWVRNSNNQVSTNNATKTAYTISRSQGSNTTLTTRCNSTSSSTGTAFTSSQVVWSGLSVWAKATASTGYNVSLKHGSTTMTASGSTFTVSSSETVTSTASPKVLTITLNNNGATTAGTTAIYEKYATGYYKESACTNQMTTSANGITKPTKTGFTFKGYYTGSGGTGTQYINASGNLTSSASATNFSSNGTLYAKWTIDDPGNVTISGGATKIYGASSTTLSCTSGTSYASGTSKYYSFGYGSTWTTPSTTNTLTLSATEYVGSREYDCAVYATDGTLTSDEHTASDTTGNTATVTINNATLTFNKNGGTSGGGTRYTRTGSTGVYTGLTNSTAGTIPSAAKTGSTFLGWYNSSSGGTKVLNTDGSFTGTAVSGYTGTSTWVATTNKTLYAQYSTNVYTITLNNQSATTAGTTAIYEKYGDGYYKEEACTNKMTTSANGITTPTKTGYTFGGYYTSTNGGGTQYINASGNLTSSASTTNFSSNGTLYAKWTINNIGNPTISGGATKVYGSSTTTLTCTENTSYASGVTKYYQFGYDDTWLTASTSNTLTLSATEFVGSREYDCAVYATDGTQTTNVVTASHAGQTATVTITNATLTFNATTNSGLGGGTVYTRTGTSKVFSGLTNSTETTIPTAHKNNYALLGWYTDNTDGTKVLNADGTFTGAVTGYTDGSKWTTTTDKTLYAQFTHTYTVTINPYGGSYNNTTSTSTITVKHGYHDNKSIGTPTRSGYTFLGWYDSPSGGSQIWDENGDAVLGTYWEEDNRIINEDRIWIYEGDVTAYARYMTGLTISEVVKGNGADTSKEFSFTINVKSNGTGISGTYAYTGSKSGNLTFSGGNATFTLHHGQHISINFPTGYTYTITQSNGNYTLTKTNDTGTITGDITATFTDTLSGAPPTGLALDIMPYLVLLIGLVCIGIVLIKFNKIKKNY